MRFMLGMVKESEQNALEEFERWKSVVIFDCGYPVQRLNQVPVGQEIKYVMRVQRGFNPYIDTLADGSTEIKPAKVLKIRAVVFRLTSGEREVLITNLREDEMGRRLFRNCITRDGLWKRNTTR
jgi:hypothetical protein